MNQFIRTSKSTWHELENLVDRFDRKTAKITAAEIERLTQLYKTVSSHLAYAQTNYPQGEIVADLNQLLSRAHNILYKDQFKSGHQLSYFFKVYFVSLLSVRKTFVLISFLLFLIGGISGFLSIWSDPLNLYAILPPDISENVDPNRVGKNGEAFNSATMSTTIMTNNIQVAFFAFMGGITLGIWTIYLLLYNGLIIGALAALFWQSGKSYLFWAYILPHGVIELAAIFIAGASGLYMGYRFLVPGPYPRKLLFLHTAKESAQLLLGTLPLFVIAGLIEGFITPSSLSLEAKYGVALMTFILIAGYYFYALRTGKKQATTDDIWTPQSGH